MRKVVMIIWSVLAVAGCTPVHMVKVENCPDLRTIKPPAGKSALVIAETASYEDYDADDNRDILNYLDRKFIGSVRGFSFLTTTVEPGEHYVTSNSENNETILLNFKPGVTYYLEQVKSMGFTLTRTRYVLVNGDRAFNDLKGKGSCYEPDARNPGADLDEDTFKEIVSAYIKKKGKVPLNEADPAKFIKWEGMTVR